MTRISARRSILNQGQKLKEVDEQLAAKSLVDKKRGCSKKQNKWSTLKWNSVCPPGIIVKGCLDDCDVCEPLLKEKLQLENDLLRKQIELLEKSQEYRCCPPPRLYTD